MEKDSSLLTSLATEQGRSIRQGLNEALLSESIIVNHCGNFPELRGSCDELSKWSDGLNDGYYVADLLASYGANVEYNTLMESLTASKDFVKGFAIGALKGSVEMVVALPLMVASLPDIGLAISKAVQGNPSLGAHQEFCKNRICQDS